MFVVLGSQIEILECLRGYALVMCIVERKFVCVRECVGN
jgi:hypothetical protein